MPALLDLLKPRSQAEVLQSLIDRLAALGFAPSDWIPGSIGRTLLELEAEQLADLSQMIPKLAASGFVDLAEGEWLDLIGRSQYGLDRKPATVAEGMIRLTADAGFGPYEISVGDLWAVASNGARFNNVMGGTLPAGGSLDLRVRAEAPGTAYNVAAGAITRLATPLPGVSVTNPAGWLLVSAIDTETDAAYRERLKLRWAELGYGATADAYRSWALTNPGVEMVRVLADQPRGPGTVDVVLWTPGGLADGVVAAVDAFIQARRPLCVDVRVQSATVRAVSWKATVYVPAARQAEAQEALAAQQAVVQRRVGIGGTLFVAALVDALMNLPGAVNAVIVQPAADIVLGEREAVALVPDITFAEP